MPVNKTLIYDPGIYFITFTNYKWLPLIEITNSYDLVYKWFDVLKSHDHHVVGYVIMPNHIHVLIGFGKVKKSINTIVGSGKRFMAYEIIDRLTKQNKNELLTILSENVTPSNRRRGKLHEVFEPSFDIKQCRTIKFTNQKLAYMHANPVSKKWMLVTNAIDYIHSSMGFYETGLQGKYEVMNYADWIEDKWVNEYRLGGVTKNKRD